MKSLFKHTAALTVVGSLIAAGSLFAASAAENYDTHCAKCHGDGCVGDNRLCAGNRPRLGAG